ncbi:MAG: glycosyltransferase [Eubacterium sp.]
MKKKKLLIVIQLVRRGGVELVAINFARKIDRSKFDISFLLVDPYEPQDEVLLKELEDEGFKFINMPRDAKGYLGKYKFMDSLMKSGQFDIVHSHVILFSGFVLMTAKKNGVKVRIAHSHVVKWNRKENIKYKVYKKVMQFLLNRYSTVKIGCCKAAGEYLFGKKAYKNGGTFLANGVDTRKFALNEEYRKEIRNEFEINDSTFLVGHVGTIYRIKNQSFLVEIFSEMLKNNSDAKLLLVGEKVDTKPVIEKAKELGVFDKVIFAGQRSDIYKIYSALDIMIFPSLHEALPVSLIEAQSSKLPCLIADTVTTEVKFNDNVDFMPLSSTATEWSDKALELVKIYRNDVRVDMLISTYDIKNVIDKLEKIYQC